LVSHIDIGIQVEGVQEQGVQEDIWAYKGQSNRKVELYDLYSQNIIQVIQSRMR